MLPLAPAFFSSIVAAVKLCTWGEVSYRINELTSSPTSSRESGTACRPELALLSGFGVALTPTAAASNLRPFTALPASPVTAARR